MWSLGARSQWQYILKPTLVKVINLEYSFLESRKWVPLSFSNIVGVWGVVVVGWGGVEWSGPGGMIIVRVLDLRFPFLRSPYSTLTSRPGVSNTRPAGRMWPAKVVYAARGPLKKCKLWEFLCCFGKNVVIKAIKMNKYSHILQHM